MTIAGERRPGADRDAAAATGQRSGIDFAGPGDASQSSLEDIFVDLVRERPRMNIHAIRAIYQFEMARTFRTSRRASLTPVLTTSLYFIVFGAAIGSRMAEVDGVPYGAFIVPGLMMLTILTKAWPTDRSASTCRVHRHDLRAAVRAGIGGRGVIGYVGAAATKSVMLGIIILATARLFVPSRSSIRCGRSLSGTDRANVQPVRLHHRHLGQGLRAAADRAADDHDTADLPRRHLLFDHHAAADWQTVALFNPVVYLISGLRWTFYGISDVNVGISLAATLGFLVAASPCRSDGIHRLLRKSRFTPQDGSVPDGVPATPS
jgi:ABC-2 type transport system permease protein